MICVKGKRGRESLAGCWSGQKPGELTNYIGMFSSPN